VARVLALLCLVVQLAGAAPRYGRKPIASTNAGILEAERLWTAAANERDPAKSMEAWERAADAFTSIADVGPATRSEQADAARAALIALKNALHVDPRVKPPHSRDDLDDDRVPAPRPFPPRDRKLMHVIDVYLRFDTTSDDAIGAAFLRANILRRSAHVDAAITAMLAIIDEHRDHEVAGYAANLVLDGYHRLRKYDELVAFADKLRGDARFLANKPDLAEVVDRIHVQARRKQAERLEKTAKDGHDLAAYEACGEAYLAIRGDAVGHRDGDDELLYNAVVCFDLAGSPDRALAIAAMLKKLYPSSRLVPRMLGRVAALASRIGRFADAAHAADELFTRFPQERDASRVAQDAIAWWLALGELDRAARLVDGLARLATTRRRDQPIANAGALAVIEAMLAAGRRREAAQRAKLIARAVSVGNDRVLLLRAARVLADAACPLALADERCTRPRDATLVAAARDVLRRIPGDEAARIALDLELERVVAARRPDVDRLRERLPPPAAASVELSTEPPAP
jgi:hypothetical protein